jgi:FkbM family methyltransferase
LLETNAMMDRCATARQDGEFVTIEYGGRTYRFVDPEIPQDPIYYIRKTGAFYEPEMLDDMRGRLKSGDLVVDVGANIGNHALFIAGACECDVVAIEPYQQTFNILRKNININDLANKIVAINVAIGDASGYAETMIGTPVDYGRLAFIRSDELSTVRMQRLDDLDLARPPRLVKIDVEGGEMAVLRGAEQLLRTFDILVYVEALSEQAYGEVFTFLDRLGYRAITFFAPAMFLFAKPGDALFASEGSAPGSDLGRLCMRYHAEIDGAKAKARRFRDSAAYQVGFVITAPFKLLGDLFKRWRGGFRE